ncbi:hypothetical protein DFH94DRAFT_796573 [Russula ochroleuca]|uniref:Integrase core domain-containing protein n=1 Tax=Russula ochroleuca TaxID=152965 RepID=A0A9P5TDJ6_9AGAM|nr:hypothetical protein DFH94DRAFT_796573 [Russula ochroleuca]
MTHDWLTSESTISHRHKALGLLGSGTATCLTPLVTKCQMVLDQMAKDPTSRQGPKTIQEGILFDTGISLTRDYINHEMHVQDPDGFTICEPSAHKKVFRVPLVSLGPHHEWSADGHDKLTKLGFPIWGIRDKWSGKWLGLWVVPNNRLKVTIGYLYLLLVKKLGGMPMQSTTDCGSETTLMYALASALREYFSPNLDLDELPAHVFVKSLHNITIERGWLRLCLQWGDNVKVFWEAGSEIYNPTNQHHYELAQWLWPTLIQQELDELKDRMNCHTTRYDRNKKIPSGVSPDVAVSLCTEYAGENCLQPVNVDVVQQLMDDIGDDVLRFVPAEYADRAQEVFASLGVFNKMIPHLST